MHTIATPKQSQSDLNLARVFADLDGFADLSLFIQYRDRVAQAGYHITEVKAANFQTLDCGGNPDVWQETVLQVEDLPAEDGQPMMTAGKFCSILGHVDQKIGLDRQARLTVEIGTTDEGMRVFDVAEVVVRPDRATLILAERPAICKPRHRAVKPDQIACCETESSATASCC